MIGTSIGHPIETIKVRMQSAKTTQEMKFITVFRSTVAHEGVSGFYKGLVAPLMGQTPYNTLIFTTTSAAVRFQEHRQEKLNSNITSITIINEYVLSFYFFFRNVVCIFSFFPLNGHEESCKIPRCMCNMRF